MEIMDFLTKEASQYIIITSVRSLLVETTDFDKKNYISSFPLIPLIPIDNYRCHKNVILFLGISKHPRALRSSANDSGHAQGRFEKNVLLSARRPPKTVRSGKKLAPTQLFLKLS